MADETCKEETGKEEESPFPRIYVERTLAIIKPDAIHKSEEIEDIILTSGFTILQVGLSPVKKYSRMNVFLSITRGGCLVQENANDSCF